MRSSNKLTAMALALAIGSTMSVATAFAEGEETTTAPAAAETVATTEADGRNSGITETTPENPSDEETFGNVTVKITDGGAKISFYDSSANISIICVNGAMTIDGVVITNGSQIPSDNADRFAEIIGMVNAMNINTITFTENVTEVRFDGFDMGSGVTQVNFGKNISFISDNAFSGFTGLKSVHGYKGTVAEKFANDNNLEFTALDLTELPVPEQTTTTAPSTTTAKNTTTTAATKKTTTASKATSTKKTTKATTTAKTTAATTKKSSASPKTGDKGVGAAVGVLGAAVVTIAAARRKKHE